MTSDNVKQLSELSFKLTEKLETLDPTTKEYNDVLRHKLDIEERIQQYTESENKVVISEKEDKTKKLGVWVGLGTAIITLCGKLVFDAWFANKGFYFEENGTICSKTFKRIIDNFHKK